MMIKYSYYITFNDGKSWRLVGYFYDENEAVERIKKDFTLDKRMFVQVARGDDLNIHVAWFDADYGHWEYAEDFRYERM